MGAMRLMRAWDDGVTLDAGCCALLMGSLTFSVWQGCCQTEEANIYKVQAKWWNGVETGGPGRLLECQLGNRTHPTFRYWVQGH